MILFDRLKTSSFFSDSFNSVSIDAKVSLMNSIDLFAPADLFSLTYISYSEAIVFTKSLAFCGLRSLKRFLQFAQIDLLKQLTCYYNTDRPYFQDY